MFGNVKATFLFKISDTILDQTDNIIISIMFGTLMVGMYANYYMVQAYLGNIAAIIVNGIVASFGNLYVEGDNRKSYSMFRCSQLFFMVYASICVTCYSCLIQEFVPLWVGSDYLMGYDMVFAVMTVFYLRMVTNTVWIYRSTMGLFKEVQYVNLIAAVLNIFLSVVMGKMMGVSGVIIATGISRLATSFWYEGRVVFRKLGIPVREYFKMQSVGLVTTCISLIIGFIVCRVINIGGAIGFIIKGMACCSISGVVNIFVYRKTEEFKMIMRAVPIDKVIKKIRGGADRCKLLLDLFTIEYSPIQHNICIACV